MAFALWKDAREPGTNRQEDFGTEVAKAGGKQVSQNAVSRWLSGSLAGDLDTMLAIPKALHVDPGWLYFGEESAAPAPSLHGETPAPAIVPGKSISEPGKGDAGKGRKSGS